MGNFIKGLVYLVCIYAVVGGGARQLSNIATVGVRYLRQRGVYSWSFRVVRTSQIFRLELVKITSLLLSARAKCREPTILCEDLHTKGISILFTCVKVTPDLAPQVVNKN